MYTARSVRYASTTTNAAVCDDAEAIECCLTSHWKIAMRSIEGTLANRRNSERNEAMKYLYIKFKFRWQQEHTHHCLHTTNCPNLDFAVNGTCSLWGQGKRDDLGGLMMKLPPGENWKELTKENFDMLNNLFY